MHTTGIIRRIDDLGRVVIPREIRRNLRIREGDPLEIFVDESGGVTFKKYSVLQPLLDFGQQICNALQKMTSMTAILVDRDNVIAISGEGKKELLGAPISDNLCLTMSLRRLYIYTAGSIPISVCNHTFPAEQYHVSVCVPITDSGEIIGAIILASSQDITADEATIKMAQISAESLTKTI